MELAPAELPEDFMLAFAGVAVDDFAAAASCVNQNIAAENTRLLSISLPIHREDGSPALDYSRDPALPFYKYLKMR